MQNQPQQPIRVDVSKYPDIKCVCGSMFFEVAMSVKLLPALISGTGKEELFPTPHFLCVECGTPIDPKGGGQKEPA